LQHERLFNWESNNLVGPFKIRNVVGGRLLRMGVASLRTPAFDTVASESAALFYGRPVTRTTNAYIILFIVLSVYPRKKL
jgi:hypothetical protein